MLKNAIFIDTSGYFALLSKTDKNHRKAISILQKVQKSRRQFLTTEAVLSETATLLMARGFGYLAEHLFTNILESEITKLEYNNSERMNFTRSYFLKTLDQGYSFCDCFSFIIMKEFAVKEALSSDDHFTKAGFTKLL